MKGEEETFDRTEAEAPPPLSPVSTETSVAEALAAEELRQTRSLASMRSASLRRSRTGSTLGRTRSLYEANPYDIDRVNTRESFKSGKH
jgi:hypothetical protein